MHVLSHCFAHKIICFATSCVAVAVLVSLWTRRGKSHKQWLCIYCFLCVHEARNILVTWSGTHEWFTLECIGLFKTTRIFCVSWLKHYTSTTSHIGYIQIHKATDGWHTKTYGNTQVKFSISFLFELYEEPFSWTESPRLELFEHKHDRAAHIRLFSFNLFSFIFIRSSSKGVFWSCFLGRRKLHQIIWKSTKPRESYASCASSHNDKGRPVNFNVGNRSHAN